MRVRRAPCEDSWLKKSLNEVGVIWMLMIDGETSVPSLHFLQTRWPPNLHSSFFFPHSTQVYSVNTKPEQTSQDQFNSETHGCQ